MAFVHLDQAIQVDQVPRVGPMRVVRQMTLWVNRVRPRRCAGVLLLLWAVVREARVVCQGQGREGVDAACVAQVLQGFQAIILGSASSGKCAPALPGSWVPLCHGQWPPWVGER